MTVFIKSIKKCVFVHDCDNLFLAEAVIHGNVYLQT